METRNQENPRCTVEKDLALLRRYQNGDQQALVDLFNSHFGLIYHWASKVSRAIPRANPEDLKQEACVGFLLAAKKFDTSRNDNFHGHARVIIKATLYLSPEIRLVKRSLYHNYRKLMEKQDELVSKLDRKPTVEELSEETNLSVKQVNNALNVIAAFPFPLEETEGGTAVEEPYQGEDTYQSKLIEDAINQLSPDHAEVIIRQYFLGQTQQKIAEDLGTSLGAIKMRRGRAIINLSKIILRESVQRDGT